MVFALGHPVALLGLICAFAIGIVLRTLVQQVLSPRLVRGVAGGPLFAPRRDVEVFGVVGAVFGGTGWGRLAPLPEYAPHRRPVGASRRAVVLLGAPVAVIAVSQLVLLTYRLLGGADIWLALANPATVLHGIEAPGAEQFLLSLAVGLLSFGLLDLLPLPPLDGWGLLRLAVGREGPGFQRARYWLVDQNIGTGILVIGMLPLLGGTGLLVIVLDALGAPIVRLWL